MKTLNLNFKSILKPAWLVMVAFLAFGLIACEDDDDNGNGGDDEIVLDGFYIQGDATSFTDFNDNARMEVTKNEVIQEERSTLYEAYITVKGSGGFNIIEVAGDEQMTYGPDNVSVVGESDWVQDDPRVEFKRGTYTETEETFSVSEDGLYHVAIDTELNKVVIVPVKYWGLIGGATPNGWSGDTKLEYDAFDMSSLSFSANEVELGNGEWKLRYSGGWKVALDTTVELSGGDKGVKVNTNLGGSASSLEPGGANINNENPGVYTVTFDWSISDGYSLTLDRTGDIPMTDWSDIEVDVFGTGVDSTATDAVEDPSDWDWGYAVSAGTPTSDGDIYTYSWTDVSLVPSEGDGFAFRSVDGGTYNADVWRYSILDEENSDTTVVKSTENAFGDVNFNVTQEGGYDITLEIDAASDDAASVVIVPAQ